MKTAKILVSPAIIKHVVAEVEEYMRGTSTRPSTIDRRLHGMALVSEWLRRKNAAIKRLAGKDDDFGHAGDKRYFNSHLRAVYLESCRALGLDRAA